MSRYLERLSHRAMARPLGSPLTPILGAGARAAEPLTASDPFEVSQLEPVDAPPPMEPASERPARETAAEQPAVESSAAEPEAAGSPAGSQSGIRPERMDSPSMASPPPVEDLEPPLRRAPPAGEALRQGMAVSDAGIAPPLKASDRQSLPPAGEEGPRVTPPRPGSESASPARPHQPEVGRMTVPPPEAGRAPASVAREPERFAAPPPREPDDRRPPQEAPLEPPPPRQPPSSSRATPRLEIGHLQVEVVPTPSVSPPSRQQPRTGQGTDASQSQSQRSGPGPKLRFGLGGL